MEDILSNLGPAKELIDKSNNIVIISHKNADGDTLGSTLSLYEALKNINKNVMPVCNDESLPEIFDFLPHIDKFRRSFELGNADLVIITDSGAHYMTDYHKIYPEIFDPKSPIPTINIDHHTSNDFFGKINIIDINASSTSVIIFRMFKCFSWDITRAVATLLLTGIYTDTGSFMHSNTDEETFRIASELLSRGANLRKISKDIFNTTKISTLKLWGKILERIEMDNEGVAISAVTEKDFKVCRADPKDISGVIDYVNSIPGIKFSVLLTEKGGNVKGSLRTREDKVDLSMVASRFGGGGHKKAAGFTVPGKLKKEVRWKVIEDKKDGGENNSESAKQNT